MISTISRQSSYWLPAPVCRLYIHTRSHRALPFNVTPHTQRCSRPLCECLYWELNINEMSWNVHEAEQTGFQLVANCTAVIHLINYIIVWYDNSHAIPLVVLVSVDYAFNQYHESILGIVDCEVFACTSYLSANTELRHQSRETERCRRVLWKNSFRKADCIQASLKECRLFTSG